MNPSDRRGLKAAILVAGLAACLTASAANAPIKVTEKSFVCMTKMTPVRGFYVANLAGHLKDTLKVARSKTGGVYPPGSVVQLIPTEVMVKQSPGTSPATKDWEFFELDVSAQGSSIRHRGYGEVVNRFGGNCLGCHAAAKPEWDLVCEESHGCAPVPLTRAMIEGLQRSDPRCVPANTLTPQQEDGLKAFRALTAPPAPKP
jgi:hypothetical protein